MFSKSSGWLAQLIVDGIASIHLDRTANQLKWRLLIETRRALLRMADPTVSYRFKGMLLHLPLSHDLPLIRAQSPSYSENLAHVARLIHAKYQDAVAIDVGANVGDSVALLREVGHFPILCVEGLQEYYTLLRRNTAQLEDVECENTLVGPSRMQVGPLIKQSGTAFFDSAGGGDEASQVEVRSVDEIVTAHPRFTSARLMKVDTDGFDPLIIRSAEGLLVASGPVVFFEYYPSGWPKGHDGFAIFDFLRSHGYQDVVFYTPEGDYILSTVLSQTNILEDLHAQVSFPESRQYFDVVAFRIQDHDLAVKLREMEKNRKAL